jgi:pyruvyl transferase EpsO
LAVVDVERTSGLFLGNRFRTTLYGAYASITLQLAKPIVSSAEVVVSDRLHAHILCTQLEIPHVMVDTRFGKISSFIDTWTADSNLVSVVSKPRDAIDLARSIAAERRLARSES